MRPAILILGGLDPSGGAGLQADIQTVTALGGHPLPVATCLTVQDGLGCEACKPVSRMLLARQIKALKRHFNIRAIKLGALGGDLPESVLMALPGDVPLVLDPVLSAGGGGALGLADDAFWPQLLARTTLITPNPSEAMQLTGQRSVDSAAQALLSAGARHVLITGGDAPTPKVINTLYGPHPAQWALDRFQGRYRGTGCTLASAITVGLAQGKSIIASIEAAQAWVARTLAGAERLADDVWLPERSIRP